MPPKKNTSVKVSKISDDEDKKKVKNPEETDDSDTESSENESEVESEEETESSSDESDNEDKPKTKKRTKLTLEEVITKLNENNEESLKLEEEINTLSTKLTALIKKKSSIEKQNTKFLKSLTSMTKNIKTTKEKRKGNPEGGFNKKKPVPAVLIKFLDLDKNATLARPELVSAFNTKLIELKLKEGKFAKLNKEVVKSLKLDNSYINKEIDFGGLQSLIASFFTKEPEE